MREGAGVITYQAAAIIGVVLLGLGLLVGVLIGLCLAYDTWGAK